MRAHPDRGVEPPASGLQQAAASGTPIAVAGIVGGALLFLIVTRRAFKGSVVTFGR